MPLTDTETRALGTENPAEPRGHTDASGTRTRSVYRQLNLAPL